MTAFTVAFLKTETGMSEGQILLVNSVAFLGGLSSLWLLGSRLDRLGSKPVLTFCFAGWVAVLAGWICPVRRRLPGEAVQSSCVLQFLMGLLAALIQMANTRLAMAVIPVMGRNHFFAIYSTIGNVTLGLAPIGWGLLIDAVGARSPGLARPGVEPLHRLLRRRRARLHGHAGPRAAAPRTRSRQHGRPPARNPHPIPATLLDPFLAPGRHVGGPSSCPQLQWSRCCWSELARPRLAPGSRRSRA